MFSWISSNTCPLNLLLVRSYQAEIISVKRLNLGLNNETRVRVEPRSWSCDHGCRKNDAFPSWPHHRLLPDMLQSTSLEIPSKNFLPWLLSLAWQWPCLGPAMHRVVRVVFKAKKFVVRNLLPWNSFCCWNIYFSIWIARNLLYFFHYFF